MQAYLGISLLGNTSRQVKVDGPIRPRYRHVWTPAHLIWTRVRFRSRYCLKTRNRPVTGPSQRVCNRPVITGSEPVTGLLRARQNNRHVRARQFLPVYPLLHIGPNVIVYRLVMAATSLVYLFQPSLYLFWVNNMTQKYMFYSS